MCLVRTEQRGRIQMACIMVVRVHDMIPFSIEHGRSDKLKVKTCPYERLETLANEWRRRDLGRDLRVVLLHVLRSRELAKKIEELSVAT